MHALTPEPEVEPAGHAAHALEPDTEKVPALHWVQAARLVIPVTDW